MAVAPGTPPEMVEDLGGLTLQAISPMKEYQAPRLVPPKAAAILAFAGLMGMAALTGCAGGPSFPFGNARRHMAAHSSQAGSVPDALSFRLHHGGAGFAAYVVYMTEDEALGMIRRQLEEAGLDFADALPDVHWQTGFANLHMALDLFDPARHVGITHLDWGQSNMPFSNREAAYARQVADDFYRLVEGEWANLSLGVFYTPSVSPGRDVPTDFNWNTRASFTDGEWVLAQPPPEDEIAKFKSTARPILEMRLAQQVEQFIRRLEAEGVL